MASAAERVFAIPELLEQIILCIYGHQLHIVDKTHSRELFTLQRVSRNFNSAINRSTRLRFKMGISLPCPGDRELARSTALVSPFLGHVEMDVYPFTFDEIRKRPNLGGDGVDVIFIYLHVRADSFEDMVYDNVGLFGGSREIYRGKNDSWRRMKVSPVGSTIHVDVNIEFYDGSEADDHEYRLRTYVEWIFDSEWETTFGELADMLDAISHRALSEHRALQVYMIHKGDVNVDFRLNVGHKYAKSFLQSAWMHVAWMRFEYRTAWQRLKKSLDLEPFFSQKPATARLDEKLDFKNARLLQDLYFGFEGTLSDICSVLSEGTSAAESDEVQEIGSKEDAAQMDANTESALDAFDAQGLWTDTVATGACDLNDDIVGDGNGNSDLRTVEGFDSSSSCSCPMIDPNREAQESCEVGLDDVLPSISEIQELSTASANGVNKRGSGAYSTGLEEYDAFKHCVNTITQNEKTKAVDQDNSDRESTPEIVEEIGTFWILNLSTVGQEAYTSEDTMGLYMPNASDVLLALLMLLPAWALSTIILELCVALGWRG